MGNCASTSATAINTSAASPKTSMAPMKLYGMAMSTCCRRVSMVLEEKGLAYEIVPVDLFTGGNKTPEYLALQPFGKIPVLVDGDVQIFESRAILRYLATVYADKGTDLVGKTVKARALTDNWLEVEANYFNDPVSKLVSEAMFKPMTGGTTDPAVVADLIVEWEKVLDVYEVQLAKHKYIAGEDFSLADISCMPYTAYAIQAGGPGVTAALVKHPKVKAWWALISSRPSWVKLSAA
mmetsp:Transcript_22392/g.38260  ORF Transcript_22392/g.38260 Transcript_22392/m.38260 type:complete len:237 (+) Transcript_22392:54-764(+)